MAALRTLDSTVAAQAFRIQELEQEVAQLKLDLKDARQQRDMLLGVLIDKGGDPLAALGRRT